MNIKKKNTSANVLIKSVDVLKAENEVCNNAITFFEKSGINFPEMNPERPPRHRRYSINILIDENVDKIEKLNPFVFKMNRKGIIGLYMTLLKDGESASRVSTFLNVLNDSIKDGYYREGNPSFVIESADPYRVWTLFDEIFSRAYMFSTGGKEIERYSDLFNKFGSKVAIKLFLDSVMDAVAASIKEGYTIHVANIKCLTCKHCVCKDGKRSCDKYMTALSGVEFEAHPERYTDAKSVNGTLMSSGIDERIDECDHYESR